MRTWLDRAKPARALDGHRSWRLLLVGLALLTLQPEAELAAQEWRFVQPNHQARFNSPIASIHAMISKPLGRTGFLVVTQAAAAGGKVVRCRVGGQELEIIAIEGFERPMPPGAYRLELIDDLRPNEILTWSDIEIVEAPEDGADLPTIDTPARGSWFPADIATIRLAGLGYDQIWISISRRGDTKPALIFATGPSPDDVQWQTDVPWKLGSGDYQVDVYTANPSWFPQVSEATTTFHVLSPPRNVPPPIPVHVEINGP